MNRRTFLLGATTTVFAAAGAAWWLLPDPAERERRRIRTRLLDLAKALSFTEKDSPFLRMGYAERVTRFFDETVDLDLTVGPYVATESLHRSRMPEGLAGLRLGNRGLVVEFIDIAVELSDATLDPAAVRPTASAHLTSRIYFTGDRDYWVQEFRFELVRAAGDWLVRGVATVKTMER